MKKRKLQVSLQRRIRNKIYKTENFNRNYSVLCKLNFDYVYVYK